MSELNPEQKRAVETTEGPVLIVAGAGAGKTRVITHRILYLIKKGVAPHSILAITFTNKAAKEMRDRVEALLSEDKNLNIPISMTERPFVSTFHALGVHIIRENSRLLSLTRYFNIYDRSDSRRAIKTAMSEVGVDPKQMEPGAILNKISLAKGNGLSRLEYLDSAQNFIEETVANIWEKYETILTKEKALDFDDLLLTAVRLLESDVKVRERYQAIWKYMHIDEYQDTNRVQYKMSRLLTNKDKNICVVGDADQSIYGWRGATIENILDFEKDYPVATVITLERNYRSTKTILAAANNIIEKNLLRKKKTLYTENATGEKIGLLVSYSETDEARAIADSAGDIIESGTSPREIAVLYRANFQSRVLEEAFIKKNVPYQVVGVRFFERKEIKDVLSYIRAALNLDDGKEGQSGWGDVARIINVPPRGIGKVTVAKILSGAENDLPSAMQTKVKDFWKLLSDIRDEINEKKPSEVVKFVIQETGIEQMLRPRSGSGDSEDEERLLNVRELVSVAAQYDNLPLTRSLDGNSGIEALLENAALATDQDELKADKDAVKLMTVHASKGLEFEHVFVAGMEEDLFPFRHMDEKEASQSEAEEERRLFYVALTRAKNKAHLSYAITRTIYGNQRISAPSEFIENIDANLIDVMVPEKPSGVKAIFIDF